MGFISKTTIGAALVCCSIYAASPYYAGYQMFQAIKTGSEEGMTQYIDFVSVRDSIKQQVDTSIEQSSGGDPLTNSMLKAFRPMIDKMVDEMVAPDKLAAFIKTGNLKQSSRQKQKENQEQGSAETLSWYAFFDRIDRFRVNVDKLVLYMEFKEFQWKLVAVGSSDFLNFSKRRSKKVEQHVADEIDESPAPIPQAYSDLSSFKKRYADSFFINGGYGSKFELEGDLFFLSSLKNSKPTLVAFEGYDKDGNVVTRDFTAAEKEYKAKYPYYSNGSWSEEIHKISSDLKIHELKGRLQIDVPTGVESFQLSADDKGKLQKKSVSAVTLTEIGNGSVGLSLYNPYDEGEKEFVVICRNKDGKRLKTSGASWMSPQESIALPGVQGKYKARNMTLGVSGTPHSVEVYYVYKDEKVEIDFTAYQKPKFSFGELKSPIRRTRYVAPKSEPELLEVSKTDLGSITYEYKQKANYDGKERRFLHFILPNKPNTYFAKPDYSGIKLSLNNQNVDFKANKEHMGQTNFIVLFGQPNNESSESVKLDKISGKVVFSYPAKIEKKTIRQGESKNGVSLIDHNFSYPKGSSVLVYNSVWPVVSARAYDAKKREIALLDSSSWGRKENSVMFWGSPAYVEYKVATEWLALEFDINKTQDDMIIVEK